MHETEPEDKLQPPNSFWKTQKLKVLLYSVLFIVSNLLMYLTLLHAVVVIKLYVKMRTGGKNNCCFISSSVFLSINGWWLWYNINSVKFRTSSSTNWGFFIPVTKLTILHLKISVFFGAKPYFARFGWFGCFFRQNKPCEMQLIVGAGLPGHWPASLQLPALTTTCPGKSELQAKTWSERKQWNKNRAVYSETLCYGAKWIMNTLCICV